MGALPRSPRTPSGQPGQPVPSRLAPVSGPSGNPAPAREPGVHPPSRRSPGSPASAAARHRGSSTAPRRSRRPPAPRCSRPSRPSATCPTGRLVHSSRAAPTPSHSSSPSRGTGSSASPTSAPSCAGWAQRLTASPFQLLLTMAGTERDRAHLAAYLTEQHVDGVLLLSLHAHDDLAAAPRRARGADGVRWRGGRVGPGGRRRRRQPRGRGGGRRPPARPGSPAARGAHRPAGHVVGARPAQPAPARPSPRRGSTTRAWWWPSVTTARTAGSAPCARCSPAGSCRMPCSRAPT